MGISQTSVDLAQYKLDIGVGAKPDVLQSKVDLNAQKAAQLEQQKLIAQLKEELNQALNVPLGFSYEVSDSIPLNTGLSLGEIQEVAASNNPALLLARKNIDIAAITLRERRAERFPVVSFNSAYNFNRNKNEAVINSFSTLFNRTK